MTGRQVGSAIAAVFGLIYVVVNAGTLPPAIGQPLQVLGAVAFVAVLVTIRRGRGPEGDQPAGGGAFGSAYWLVVAGEAAALAAGLAMLNGPLDAPQAGAGWVSVVVGLHFLPLAHVFRQAFFRWLGAAIATCGVVGLALAAGGATNALVAAVSGVVPGALLLAAACRGARRGRPLSRARPRPAP